MQQGSTNTSKVETCHVGYRHTCQPHI